MAKSYLAMVSANEIYEFSTYNAAREYLDPFTYDGETRTQYIKIYRFHSAIVLVLKTW